MAQFGGVHLSTAAVALTGEGSQHVACRRAPGGADGVPGGPEGPARDFTGGVLNNPKVTVIGHDGCLYVAHPRTVTTSSTCRFADPPARRARAASDRREIAPTREAMSAYARALEAPGGNPVRATVCQVRRESRPSVLKLYANRLVAAARRCRRGRSGR